MKMGKLANGKQGMMQRAISIVITLFVIAILLPLALTQLAEAELTGVNPAVVTVLTVLLPVLAVISIVYLFLRRR